MPFDCVHHDGWSRTPLDYHRAGYRMINAAWSPLYVVGARVSSPEDLALWLPNKFGPTGAPSSPETWQTLPADEWEHRDVAWMNASNSWPVWSRYPLRPPESVNEDVNGVIPPGLLGAVMCSWENPEVMDEGLLFGACDGLHPPGGSRYGRPAPRVAIVGERMWLGVASRRDDLLRRTGCAYWEEAEEAEGE
mmetsp:Transcript_30438/g.65856  ORF Transcript_30438/g.65856 Transcript_30438/m.65856 type:complete len:192 (+) Transcript_30438:60-635(+)